MDFAKTLQEKLGEHKQIEVDELILDELFENVGQFTPDHKKALELYKNLVHLSLNGLGLTSLTNFPKIEELQILEVQKNKLSGSDFAAIKNLFPNLYKLKVGDNTITSLDVFKAFDGAQIRKLEVQGNPIASKANYKEELFKMLKHLEVIDGHDKNGQEIDSTIYDEEGDEFDEDEDGEDEEFDEEDDEEFEEEDDDEDEDEESEEEKPEPKKQRKK